ncbi:MAG: hypothetical protein HQL82_12600 [Magnetococcales bacterium]|nr:hypothetical protein [Magnetococcales bacterium]
MKAPIAGSRNEPWPGNPIGWVIGFLNIVALFIVSVAAIAVLLVVCIHYFAKPPPSREQMDNTYRRLHHLVALYEQDVASLGKQGCCQFLLNKDGKLEQELGGVTAVSPERQAEYEKYMAEVPVTAIKPLCTHCRQILFQRTSEPARITYYLYSDVILENDSRSCSKYIFERSDGIMHVDCFRVDDHFYDVVFSDG